MYYKLLATLLILSLSFTNCVAQVKSEGDVWSFSKNLMKWIDEINTDMDSFFIKEKAQQLNRKLVYLRTDMKEYLRIRKNLMNFLDSNKYNIAGQKTQQTVSLLRNKLTKLKSRLKDVSNYVDTQLSRDASDRVEKMQDQQNEQSLSYIGVLEDLIKGKKINKEHLQHDGKLIYEKLLTSIGMIYMIQTELQIKFNI